MILEHYVMPLDSDEERDIRTWQDKMVDLFEPEQDATCLRDLKMVGYVEKFMKAQNKFLIVAFDPSDNPEAMDLLTDKDKQKRIYIAFEFIYTGGIRAEVVALATNFNFWEEDAHFDLLEESPSEFLSCVAVSPDGVPYLSREIKKIMKNRPVSV